MSQLGGKILDKNFKRILFTPIMHIDKVYNR